MGKINKNLRSFFVDFAEAKLKYLKYCKIA